MADAMQTARNEGIPALPPLQPDAPVVYMPDEGDGQNWPSASDVSAIGASTTPTPPQQILVQADSAVLSIMNAATSSSGDAVNRDDANDTPRKQHGGSSQNSRRIEARYDCRQWHSGEDATTPLHHQCRRCHHSLTSVLSLWTMVMIDDDDAV